MPETLAPDVYRAVLEALPLGVFYLGRDRRILLWNDGAERITGYLRQEVIGRTCRERPTLFCDGAMADGCDPNCPLCRAIREGCSTEEDVLLSHKDGTRVPVHVRVLPVRDPGGFVLGFAVMLEEHAQLPEFAAHAHTRALNDSMDELTGIPDHDSTYSHVTAVIEDFADEQIPFGVLVIEVGNLAELRQSHGMKAAEAMLRLAARTLKKNFRAPDMVGRWSEGRFLVVLTNCPVSALDRVTGMLEHTLSVAALPWWGDRVAMRVAVGGAVGRAGDTAESLLGRAEEALTNALAGGDGGAPVIHRNI